MICVLTSNLCFEGGDNWQPNLILDDGGDATHILTKKFSAVGKQLKGIVEDSVTGVHRLYQLVKNADLSCPAMNVHDAVTRTMINNYYCQKESLIDALKVRYQHYISSEVKIFYQEQ